MSEPKTGTDVEAPDLDREERWKRAAARAPDTPMRDRANASRLESDPTKSSYAGYLFGTAGTADRPAWSDSTKGRAAIRIISRGVFGAGFFVLGGHIANQQMLGYESFKPLRELDPKKPLQYVARFWDVAVGKPAELIAYRITPVKGLSPEAALKRRANAAWDATKFRSKQHNVLPGMPNSITDRYGQKQYLNGRGLGHEVVMVTFDFFMASIGDATARNMIQSLDPNVKQPWFVDDKGHATTRDKGHWSPVNSAKAMGRASWRILSKNAGEDWAAALPYVYFMKWQRQALAKWWPGFKLSSDNGWNGGMANVITHGPKAGVVESGYQLPGLIDLQTRFMTYNWFTLMYREMYDTTDRRLREWKNNGYQLSMPHIEHPFTAAIDSVGFSARYVMKSMIKSAMYMAPAVPFFWVFRTPQSKWRGGYVAMDLAKTIGPGAERENAFITMTPHGLATGGTPHDPIFLENAANDLYPRAKLIHDMRFSHVTGARVVGNGTAGPRQDFAYYGNKHLLKQADTDPMCKTIFDLRSPYELGVHRKWYEHVLNVFGAASYHTGSGLTRVVDHLSPQGGRLSRHLHTVRGADGVMRPLQGEELLLAREKMLRTFVDASFSYTPYMWAKAETALRVDDRRNSDELGHMDKAIYRFIDNVCTFNFRDAADALTDMRKLGMSIEKEVKSREGSGTVVHAPAGGDGTTIPRADENSVPSTKVQARSVAHGRRATDRPVNTNPNDPVNHENTQRWAESVTGRKLDGQVLPPQPTIH
jgi:hypothetical protein